MIEKKMDYVLYSVFELLCIWQLFWPWRWTQPGEWSYSAAGVSRFFPHQP